MLRFTAAVVLGLALLVEGTAAAYTLRSSSQGQPVRWRTEVVTVVADPSLSLIDPGATAVIAAAFAEWGSVSGAFPPGVVVEEGTADEVGYRPGGTNHSTIRYAPDGADWAGDALGMTLVTFDATGAILDADVLINGGAGRPFALVTPGAPSLLLTDEQRGAYDLQDIATHEIGHFFGLGESSESLEATMFPTSKRLETKKRDLDPDDEQGLQSLYGEPPATGCAASGVGAPPRQAMQGGASVIVLIVVWLLTIRVIARRRGRAAAASLVALSLLLHPSAATASSPAPVRTVRSEPSTHVLSVSPRWEHGVIVSEVVLETTSCDASGCQARTVSSEVVGGTLDGISQVASYRVPHASAARGSLFRGGG